MASLINTNSESQIIDDIVKTIIKQATKLLSRISNMQFSLDSIVLQKSQGTFPSSIDSISTSTQYMEGIDPKIKTAHADKHAEILLICKTNLLQCNFDLQQASLNQLQQELNQLLDRTKRTQHIINEHPSITANGNCMYNINRLFDLHWDIAKKVQNDRDTKKKTKVLKKSVTTPINTDTTNMDLDNTQTESQPDPPNATQEQGTPMNTVLSMLKEMKDDVRSLKSELNLLKSTKDAPRGSLNQTRVQEPRERGRAATREEQASSRDNPRAQSKKSKSPGSASPATQPRIRPTYNQLIRMWHQSEDAGERSKTPPVEARKPTKKKSAKGYTN